MYEEIKKKILLKKNDIDERTLKYFANYFTVVVKRNLIPEGMNIDELIDNVLRIGEIYFFEDDDPITEKYGNKFKGKKDVESKRLYVRNSLPDDLKEMVVYHEIHHAAQTSEEMLSNGSCGINQEANLGKLIMEAQTEWFAEEIYKEFHGTTFEEKEIPSEKLRMQANQTIRSSLHNYEMYGALLKKLAIIMDVSEEYFVKINFMYHNNTGLKQLQEDYDKIKEKKGFPFSFTWLMLVFDYAYAVDSICYIKQLNSDLVLSGGETKVGYTIHPNIVMPLSQKEQANKIYIFDAKIIKTFLSNSKNLLNFYSDFVKFSNYIFDNKLRDLVKKKIQENANNKTDEESISSGIKR